MISYHIKDFCFVIVYKVVIYKFKINLLKVRWFLGLWPYVKSKGGVYVIEDMNQISGGNSKEITAIYMIHKLIMQKNEIEFGDKNSPMSAEDKAIKTVAKTVLSINCYFGACVLIKK